MVCGSNHVKYERGIDRVDLDRVEHEIKTFFTAYGKVNGTGDTFHLTDQDLLSNLLATLKARKQSQAGKVEHPTLTEQCAEKHSTLQLINISVSTLMQHEYFSEMLQNGHGLRPSDLEAGDQQWLNQLLTASLTSTGGGKQESMTSSVAACGAASLINTLLAMQTFCSNLNVLLGAAIAQQVAIMAKSVAMEVRAHEQLATENVALAQECPSPYTDHAAQHDMMMQTGWQDVTDHAAPKLPQSAQDTPQEDKSEPDQPEPLLIEANTNRFYTHHQEFMRQQREVACKRQGSIYSYYQTEYALRIEEGQIFARQNGLNFDTQAHAEQSSVRSEEEKCEKPIIHLAKEDLYRDQDDYDRRMVELGYAKSPFLSYQNPYDLSSMDVSSMLRHDSCVQFLSYRRDLQYDADREKLEPPRTYDEIRQRASKYFEPVVEYEGSAYEIDGCSFEDEDAADVIRDLCGSS